MTGRSPRMARSSPIASRMASVVASDCTPGLQHERSGTAPDVEARARAVGVALLLAQVHVDPADELAAEDHVEREQRVIVGRAARSRTRGRCAAPTAPRPVGGRARSRSSGGGGARPDRSARRRCGAASHCPNALSASIGQTVVRRVADDDERGEAGIVSRVVKPHHVVDRERGERGLGADRQVPVGVLAVEALHEHALGDGRRHVAQLRQAIEAQLADAIELACVQARAGRQIGQQIQAALGEPLQRRDAEQRGVGADLRVEAGAETAECLVELQCVQGAACPRPGDRR